jgi:UDP-GlcNAc:undecaprenyl-phosphate/decaprenyl-phosphate GlcNAc-1-phosphate transferase
MILTLPLSFFVISAILTALAYALSARMRWTSTPTANRLSATSTPVWGGVAICLTFLLSTLFQRFLVDRNVILLICIATCAFALGLVDDLWKLRPMWKLSGQVLLSFTFLMLGPSVSFTGVKLLDFALALVWLVGITNAFNLLDNINGLSAGTAVLAAVFESALFFFSGDPSHGLLCLAFAGATLGFLVFNFPSGCIFMGDSGSHFIGFWLAGITLVGINAPAKSHLGSILFPVMLMVVPICDTTLVTLTRRVRRQPISVGGTDHLSHRLLAYGFSETGAVVALWCLSLLNGLVAVLAVIYGTPHFISGIALLFVSVAVFGVYLTRFELFPRSAAGLRSDAGLHLPMWLGVSVGVAFDVVLIIAAYYTAYLLRFDGEFTSADTKLLGSSMAELVLIKLAAFVALGSYRCWWLYFGLRDAFRIGWASVLASLSSIAYFSAIYRFQGFSRIVFVLDFLVFTLLALVFRFSFRLFDSFAPANHKTNVLIYGVDDEGESTLHFVTKQFPLRVIGFLDSDASKKNLLVHSVPVLGNLSDLEKFASQWNVQAVLLTSSTALEVQNRIRLLCQRLHIGLLRMRFELEDLQQTRDSSNREPTLRDSDDAVLVKAAPASASRTLS